MTWEGPLFFVFIFPVDMLTLFGKVKKQHCNKKYGLLNKVKMFCEYITFLFEINLLRRR